MKTRNYIRATAAIGTLLVANAASAFDDKTFPGTVCFPTGATGTWLSVSHGSVFNTSTNASQNVTCPLVRDGASIQFANAKVWVGTSTPVSCTLHGQSGSGSFFVLEDQTKSASKPTNSLNEFQAMVFGPFGTYDHYYADCTIPKAESGLFSHIASFYLEE